MFSGLSEACASRMRSTTVVEGSLVRPALVVGREEFLSLLCRGQRISLVGVTPGHLRARGRRA